jgi:hypothetical protein
MLSDLVVARAYLHTDRIDLARAGEIDCAWHSLFRRISGGFVATGRWMTSWLS